MTHVEKTVFVSYRRDSASIWALAIYQHLTSKGFDVFFDYTGIDGGDFERIILENIQSRAHFLVLLTPSALDRCDIPGDWLRREIEQALEVKRNIVPILLEGFDFNAPVIKQKLTGQLTGLDRYNGLPVALEFFEAAMNRLSDRFLNHPLNAMPHPASELAQQAAKVQQAAATAVLQMIEHEPPVRSSNAWETTLPEEFRLRYPRFQRLIPVVMLVLGLVIGVAGVSWVGDWPKAGTINPDSSAGTVKVGQLKTGNIQPLLESDPSTAPQTKAAAPIERVSLYAKILFFRDKRLAERHMETRMIRPLGGTLKNQPNSLNNVELYDEAIYLRTYHLRKDHPDELTFRSISSGITDVIGISPDSIDFKDEHIEEYERTGYKTLIYSTAVSSSNDIQIAHKYYNGYQYNQIRKKYESDGFLNLDYAAREVVVTFDFSSIVTLKPDNQFRLRGEPKLTLHTQTSKTQIEGRFTNGILISATIKDVPRGARIICDWEWETEEQKAMTH